MAAPEYKFEVPLPEGPQPTLQPPAPPSFEGANEHFKAIEGFGKAMMQAGAEIRATQERIRAAQDQTQVATRTAEYLTELDKLEDGTIDGVKAGGTPADGASGDGAQALQATPKDFAEQQRALMLRLSEGIANPQLRARTMLEWTRSGIAAGNRVRTAALAREADVNVAAGDSIEQEALRSAGNATTDVERSAARSRYFGWVDQAAARGWINQRIAGDRKQRFEAHLDDADVVREIRKDPRAALEALQDPKRFPNLQPLHRQNRINEAAGAVDRIQTLELQNTATRDPARAAVTVGRVGGAADSNIVFERVIGPSSSPEFLRERRKDASVRVEGLNPVFAARFTKFAQDAEAATGHKVQINDLVRDRETQARYYRSFLAGSGGLAAPPGQSRHDPSRGQAADVQPGPALDWMHKNAHRYGLEFLKGNAFRRDPVHVQLAASAPEVEIPALVARDVAKERLRWQESVARYDGQLAPAIAAFVVGHENTDRWQAAAQEKFGRYFTAQQFLTVVDDDKAKKAIADAHKRADAPLDGGGLSPTASLHAASVVSSAISQDERARSASINHLAQIAREGLQPAKIFEAGYEVDPQKLANWKLAQAQAAANGNAEAARALNEVEFQQSMLPFRQAALRTPPAELEALVEAEDARLRASPDVSNEEKNRLDIGKAVLANVKKARDDNLIGLGEDANLVPAHQRVNVPPNADPASPDFVRALALRGDQANTFARFYGGNTALALKPHELGGFKTRWAAAGPEEKFRLLAGFGAGLTGRAFDDTIDAVAGKDPVIRFAAQVSRDRPELAREILEGHALIKAAGEKQDKAMLREALAATLGGQLYPSADMQNQAVQAAEAVAVARAGRAGVLYEKPDAAALEQAVQAVTGPIVTRNGIKLPLPPTLPRADAEDVLNNLSDAMIATIGGALDQRGNAMPAADIARYGWLRPLQVGGSRYVVDMPSADGRGRPVFAEDGSSLILDLALLARRPRGLAVGPADLSTRGVSGGAMMP